MRRPKRQWVYYVETDHWTLPTAGLSTSITPLLLKYFGAEGWYCWGSFLWSMPYTPTPDYRGPKYDHGPVVNPWLNPFYHHGPGALAFFYPPDPRGIASHPTDRVIPSYRMILMREGIQLKALLDVLEAGWDDAGQRVVVNSQKLSEAKSHLRRFWTEHPVQWYVSRPLYHTVVESLYEAVTATAPAR